MRAWAFGDGGCRTWAFGDGGYRTWASGGGLEDMGFLMVAWTWAAASVDFVVSLSVLCSV